MWLKRLILGTLLLGPGLALAEDEFDITMDVVASDESFDEAVVNQIELPFGQRDGDGKLQPAALSDSPLDQLEDLVGERISGGSDSPGTESPGGDLGGLDSLESNDLMDSLDN